MKDFSDPLPRVVNDFRIVPVPISAGSYLWKISPNRTSIVFYFTKLDLALTFAKKHKNNHTDKYWFKQFSPIYSYPNACKLAVTSYVRN